MDNALNIAMTPAQLAAIMSDETISKYSVSDRIWGGVGFLGGVLELAGATALCLVPEPTGLTKAGCIIVGAHSMDGISASAYQIYSGKQTLSMTAKAATGIAQELGAEGAAAEQIGLAVDIIIPFAVAGAARVASVKMGRVRLIKHESITGFNAGGHTIKKHVGKTAQELRDKIARGKQSGTFNAGHVASSYISLEIAETAVSKAIRANRNIIRRWAKMNHADSKNLLILRYDVKTNVGIIVKPDTPGAITSSKIEIIIRKKQYNKKPYYILTSYPVI